MKRLILMLLAGFFVASFICSQVLAKEEKLHLSVTASSTYETYTPDKAVDGDENTYWIGQHKAIPWEIIFDTKDVNQIGYINIKWFSTYYYYPEDYDIQTSIDGINWEDSYINIRGVYDVDGEVKEIDKKARYIRLYIRSVKERGRDKVYCPVLREFEAYAKIVVPRILRFQGRLSNDEGAPLDGTFTLTFKLYDTDTGGSACWEEVQQDIDIKDGILDVELGSETPLDVRFNREYWLGVEIESDGEMTPRFKLTSVPYALMSEE